MGHGEPRSGGRPRARPRARTRVGHTHIFTFVDCGPVKRISKTLVILPSLLHAFAEHFRSHAVTNAYMYIRDTFYN